MVEENKIEDYEISLDVMTKKKLLLFLYKNVQNIEEVYRKVISEELPCCILKANLIVDPFQILIAANKAALNEKYQQMVTRTLYTEVAYCLCPSKNISQSLNTFGAASDTKSVFVVLLYDSLQDKEAQKKLIIQSINGERLPLWKLKEISETDLIKKTYKIHDQELKVSSLLDSIVSRMSEKFIK